MDINTTDTVETSLDSPTAHGVPWDTLLRILGAVAWRWYLRTGQTIPLEEFVSEGHEALMTAWALYDPARGQAKFTTYAYAVLSSHMRGVVRREWQRRRQDAVGIRPTAALEPETRILLQECVTWLEHLPHPHAVPFVEQVLQEKTRHDTQVQYGISRPQIGRSIANLRRWLGQWREATPRADTASLA